jgi:hypothetical protein
MKTLRQVIEVFQREVTAALESMKETGQGMDWKPERVTLSLEVILDEAGVPRARFVSPDSKEAGPGGHRLSIEFRLHHSQTMSVPEDSLPATRMEQEATQGINTRTEKSESEMTRTYQDLRAVLGEPGFDSSARAAVFCQALQTLSLAQAFALCGALTSPAAEVDDENLRRARHQMLGIIRSGSLKSPERAAEILSRVFEHWPLPSLVQFVTDRWKTNDTWAK